MTSIKTNQPYLLGEWLVTPDQNKISNAKVENFIEPKLMLVLNYLCLHAPNVIENDKLIEVCWPNQFFSDNPLHKCIAQLRKILGDNAKNPKYIKTYSKKGYAVIARQKTRSSESEVNKIIWDKNPYLGLEQYSKQFVDIYFGRTKALSEIKSLINKLDEHDLPLIIISGLSGVGKTSLINAKTLPYLINPVHPFKVSYSDSFYFDFEKAGTDSFVTDFISFLINHQMVVGELSCEAYMSELLGRLEAYEHNDKHIFVESKSKKTQKVIFLDHLDKIIVNKNNTHAFNLVLLLISELLKSNDYLILLCIRTENLETFKKLFVYQLIKNEICHYELQVPNDFEIAEIVQKPILAAGLTYEFNKTTFKSLDSQIIDDAKNIGNILPLLSLTLQELCENKNDENQLTYANYKKIGELSGVLTYKVNKIIKDLSDGDKYLLNKILHHFILYKPNSQNKYQCVKVSIDKFKVTEFNQLIQSLLNAGLLKSQNTSGQILASILHPSVLMTCDFFITWLKQNQVSLSVITEINTHTNQWNTHGRNSNYLLGNQPLLNQFNDLVEQQMFEFDTDVLLYIRYSNKQNKLRSRLKYGAVFCLVLLLLASSYLMFLYRNSNNELVKTNNQAESLITFMLGDLKQKILPSGQLAVFEIIGEQVIHYYENRSNLKHSDTSMLQYSNALNILGEVKVNRGELIEAVTYFEQAISNDIAQFKNKESHIQALFSYSQSNYWLGYINYLQKRFDSVLYYWEKYLDFSEQLTLLEPDNEIWKLERSYALNNLGTLSFGQNKFHEAEQYFHISEQIKTQILNANPNNSNYLIELADTVSWQANVLAEKNELLKSRDVHLKSLDLTEKLSSLDKRNNVWNHRLALTYFRVALSHYELGEIEQAQKYLDQSIPIYNKLNHLDVNHQVWIKELINNYTLYSKISRHLNDYDTALDYLQKSISLFKTYTSESQALKFANVQNLYISAEFSLILLNLGQHKTAMNKFSQSIQEFEKNDISNYVNKDYYKAYMNFIMAQLKTANNQLDQAQLLLNQALAVLEPEISTTDDKKSIALYLAIEKSVFSETVTQSLYDHLLDINYLNPDFTSQL